MGISPNVTNVIENTSLEQCTFHGRLNVLHPCSVIANDIGMLKAGEHFNLSKNLRGDFKKDMIQYDI